MTDHVIVDRDGAVCVVTMNRPDKKNALTQAMYRAMCDAINGAEADPAIRCILVRGLPGAFTAGNDLDDFLKASQSSGPRISAALDFLRLLVTCGKPLVAAVDGLAVGIGTTMLFHFDFVAASTRAVFSTPFMRLGLVPEGGSSLLAPRTMGHHRAFSMLVMGRPVSAAEAHAAGFVSAVADPADVDAAAGQAAQEIAALPPEAMAISRRLLRPAPEETLRAIDQEAHHFAERMRSPEAIAAFTNFLARKK